MGFVCLLFSASLFRVLCSILPVLFGDIEPAIFPPGRSSCLAFLTGEKHQKLRSGTRQALWYCSIIASRPKIYYIFNTNVHTITAQLYSSWDNYRFINSIKSQYHRSQWGLLRWVLYWDTHRMYGWRSAPFHPVSVRLRPTRTSVELMSKDQRWGLLWREGHGKWLFCRAAYPTSSFHNKPWKNTMDLKPGHQSSGSGSVWCSACGKCILCGPQFSITHYRSCWIGKLLRTLPGLHMTTLNSFPLENVIGSISSCMWASIFQKVWVEGRSWWGGWRLINRS